MFLWYGEYVCGFGAIVNAVEYFLEDEFDGFCFKGWVDECSHVCPGGLLE